MAEQGLLDADLVQRLDQLGVFGQTVQAKTDEEVFSRMLSLLVSYEDSKYKSWAVVFMRQEI